MSDLLSGYNTKTIQRFKRSDREGTTDVIWV